MLTIFGLQITKFHRHRVTCWLVHNVRARKNCNLNTKSVEDVSRATRAWFFRMMLRCSWGWIHGHPTSIAHRSLLMSSHQTTRNFFSISPLKPQSEEINGFMRKEIFIKMHSIIVYNLFGETKHLFTQLDTFLISPSGISRNEKFT
jgi:hypothetical protein